MAVLSVNNICKRRIVHLLVPLNTLQESDKLAFLDTILEGIEIYCFSVEISPTSNHQPVHVFIQRKELLQRVKLRLGLFNLSLPAFPYFGRLDKVLVAIMTSNIVRSRFFVESEKDTERQVVLVHQDNDTACDGVTHNSGRTSPIASISPSGRQSSQKA